PVVWDLGHVANFEEQWSIRALDPAAPADFVRDRIYDPIANPRPTRKHLPLGNRTACLDYLHELRQRARQRLAQLDLDASAALPARPGARDQRPVPGVHPRRRLPAPGAVDR